MTAAKILLVDREPAGSERRLIEHELDNGYELTFRDAATLDNPGVLEHPTDAAVVIVRPGATEPSPESLLTKLRRHDSHLPVLSILDSADASLLRRAASFCLSDFVVLPVPGVELQARLQRLIRRAESPPAEECDEVEDEKLVSRLKQRLGGHQLIGRSPAMLSAVRRVDLLSRCDSTVLIRGETGTGKELCARAIHYLSARSGEAFVPINCGALPMELFENELFGHDQEAYTGAASRRHGLIRDAEGGTLFLDEVDALTTAAQVKLLRLLQNREYRPLGSTRTETANVRVVAATNDDLERAVRDGRMREDFFYRINVLPITMPPLRDRAGDVAILARHILRQTTGRMNRPTARFSNAAMLALVQYDWPGNVRELENVVERAVVLTDGRDVLEVADVQIPTDVEECSFREAKSKFVQRFERTYIENLLSIYAGNISQAALAAKKHRRAFWELIRKHGIDPECFRPDKPK